MPAPKRRASQARARAFLLGPTAAFPFIDRRLRQNSAWSSSTAASRSYSRRVASSASARESAL